VQTQDLWYTYDAMNRVKISQGMNAAGSIVFNTAQGIELTYNLKGERTSARTNGEHVRVTQTLFNGVVTSTLYYRVANGLFTEQYSYDGLGRLIATDIVADRTATDIGTGGVISGTWLARKNTRVYDAASREVTSFSYSIDEDETGGVQPDELHTETRYDGDGRTSEQTTYKNGIRTTRVVFGDATFKTEEVVSVTSDTFKTYASAVGSRSGTSGQSYKALAVPGNSAFRKLPVHWADIGWDSAGNLIGYRVEYYKETNGNFLYSTTHEFDYRRTQGYQLIGERTESTDKGPSKGSTTRTYNVNGELVQYSDAKDKSKNRYFANDAEGRALTVVNGKFDGQDGRLTVTRAFDNALTRTGNKVKAQYFFFANGQNLGTFGQLVDADGLIKANFDVNYTPVSANYPASTPSQVIAQNGDTLRSIASRVFGDANLWYVIAEANGLTDPDAVLEAGQPIDIPNKVLSVSNDAQSFKPYDASLALGDTTPTQPFPKGGCGVLGTLILAVVAVIVAAYTAGAASTALASLFGGTVTGGSALTGTLAVSMSVGGATSVGASTAIGIGAAMVGGAAASAVTQGLAILTDYQDSFSWKGVAMGAIGAGVTSGLGFLRGFAGVSTNETLKFLSSVLKNPAGNAVMNNMLTQGIGVLTKVQDNFNWRDVAISGTAATAGAVASYFGGGGLSTGVVSTFVRAKMHGTVNTATALADFFGSVLGDSLVGTMLPNEGPGFNWEKWREGRISSTASEAAPPPVPGDLVNKAEADAQAPTNKLNKYLNPDLSVELSSGGVTTPVEPPPDDDEFSWGGIGSQGSALGAAGEPESTKWKFYGESGDGTVYHSTGDGVELVGQVTATNDTSGLKPIAQNTINGVPIRAYVDEAGTKMWGWISDGRVNPFRVEDEAPVERRQVELDADRASISEYAESFRGSVKGDLWGNAVEIFGHGGNSLFQAGSMAWGLFDDRKFRAQVDAGLTKVVFHPIRSGIAAYGGLRNATADFYGLPLDQQMKSIGDASFALASGIGSEKALGLAGKGILRAGQGAATGLRNLWSRAGAAAALTSNLRRIESGVAGLDAINTKFGVLRSPNELMGVEPASQELLTAIGSKRNLIIAKAGSEELRMLDYFGAEASVGGVNNSSILLRETPSKAAALEEFLHGTQTRLGIVDRLGTSGMGSAETHVKDFMIRHQQMLGLSDEDIRILQILRSKGL
jgi:LysM repeat protein